MDARIFEYFEALARTKNYSRAAKECFITPQGLSGAIKRYERELGVPLVTTVEGGIELTVYGEIVAQHSATIVKNLHTMSDDIMEAVRKRNGSILLAATIGLIDYFPEDFIEQFTESSACGCTIELMQTMQDEQVDAVLAEGGCDFALNVDPADHSSFCSLPLHSDTMIALIHESDPLASKERLTAEDFTGRTVYSVGMEFKVHSDVDRFFEQVPDGCNVVLVDEMIESLRRAVINPGAIGLTVRQHLDIPVTGIVGIPVEGLRWGFSLLWQKDRMLTPADEELINFMEQFACFYE